MTKICDERPVECGDPACPCHEWSAKSPSESPRVENQPAGFLVSEPESGLERKYAQSSPISARRDHVLYTEQDCQVFHSEDRQCPVCEGGLAVCRNCKEYEAGLDNPCKPSSNAPIPATPDFDHEWEAAPRGMTNYVERSIAEYWFLRGRRAGGVKSDDRGEPSVPGDG